jgi:hypothetical protein
MPNIVASSDPPWSSEADKKERFPLSPPAARFAQRTVGLSRRSADPVDR